MPYMYGIFIVEDLFNDNSDEIHAFAAFYIERVVCFCL